MPFFKIQTNKELENQKELLRETSKFMAGVLGKPERYIMLSLHQKQDMFFGGSDEATIYCELKSIGLPKEKSKEISKKLCTFLADKTGVASDRIYIEFFAVERNMWGWNKTTFEK